MNQVAPRTDLKQPSRQPLAILLLLILLLTACIGGNEEETAAPEAAAQQPGSLICSQTCLAQGQCGTAADGQTVVLGHSGQPVLRDHDTLLANEVAIVIAGQQTRTVLDITGATSNMNFFAVQPPEGGPVTWVSGSCVNITVQQ